MTALTLYGSNIASTTLTTADQLSTTTGGTQTSKATTIATGNGYIECLSQGGSTTVAASIPAPTGKGWLLDSTLLVGNTLSAGAFSATVALSDTPSGGGAYNMTLRLYKRSSAGVYTFIGSMLTGDATNTNPNAVPFNSSRTTYTYSGTMPATTFATGDKLYIDHWINALGWASETINFYVSNSATAGVASDLQVVTNGYVPTTTPASKSVPIRTRVRTNTFKSMPVRTRVRTQAFKSLPIRTRVTTNGTRVLKSIPLRTRVQTTNARSLPLRTRVRTRVKPSIPIRTVVQNPNYSYVVWIDGRAILPSFAGENLCVVAGSLIIDSTIGKRSTASFSIHSDSSVHFQQYQQVKIYDKENYLVFSGYITQPKETKPGWQPTLNHQISCVDQHFLADKRVVAATFTNKTCGYIAKWLVDNVLASEGVTIGQIYDGPVPSPTLYPSPDLFPGGNVGIIPRCTFVYCSVAQAMDSLVTAASTSGIPYYWQIDQNKQLWLVPYTAVVNTNIVDGTTMEQGVNPPSVTRQNPSYRNTQYITGGVAETLQQVETRKGDGDTIAWTLGYELARVPTVKVNGVTKITGIKGVDSGKDYYWNKGDATLTQDSAATKLTSSDTLEITYIGQYPTVIIAQDASQVAFETSIDGTTGIVESVQQDSTISSAENGMSLASQLLNRYAQQALQFQFTTRDNSYTQGQLITVDLPDFNLDSAQMLISDVSASDQTDGFNIYYSIQAILGPYDVSWVQFFATMLKQQTPPDAINIGVSQTLTIAAIMNANMSTSATFNVTVYPSLLPSPTLYPSTTRYPA